MLVLSRRPNEKIVLPTVGVTVHVLHAKANQVKLGIQAPPAVKVLRHELEQHGDQSSLTHGLANMLNKISLTLHLLERQWESGQAEVAKATLAHVHELLANAERDWVAPESPPEKPKKKPVAKKVPKPKKRAKTRTLVVEDDKHERQLLANLLEMNGYECPTAADGQEALDYLSRHDRPDFVLMDLMMPRLDGRHAMRRLRDDPRFRDLKIFAISNMPPQDTGPGGFDAWFAKPLNIAKLLEAIRKSQQN